MSDLERIPGRELLTLVEIDQDFCELTYGESPCTAGLGVTGQRKCFNTNFTCQDSQNYERGTRTLTFAMGNVSMPRDRNIIPLLESVSSSPTQINIGGGDRDIKPLGKRAVVDITFRDAPYSDLLTDKYRDERMDGSAQMDEGPYDPLNRGTFWGKWNARNPYYQNRRVRIREGYVGQDPEDMVTRHYFIDRVTGPDDSGRVTVRAKDVLKLADDTRAQWPEPSPGTLLAGIDEVADEFRVVGAQASDYDPSALGAGTVRIGDEVIQWASLTVDGDELVFSSLTRGSDNTETESHDEEDTVQRCVRYQNETLEKVVADDLLKDAASVPPEFINESQWQAEIDRWLTGFRLSTVLTEPYGVNELLSELTEQALFFIWWNERTQQIGFRAIRPVDPLFDGEVKQIDDEYHVLSESFSQSENPEQRISRVWTGFRQIDPTEDLDERKNFRRWRVRVSPSAESEDQYGERRTRWIYARWLQGDAQAATLNQRLLARYRDNPKRITIALDAKDRDLSTADVVDLTHRNVVDDTGKPRRLRYQVIKENPARPGHRYEYTLQRFLFSGRYAFFTANDAPEYSNASTQLREQGAWWSPDGDGFADGTQPYRFI